MSVKLLSICLLVPFLVTGCGGSDKDRGPLGTLSCAVFFEEEPLTEGSVFLQHQDGSSVGSGGGDIQPDGTFEVLGGDAGGIPIGNYDVWFTPPMVEVPGGNSPGPIFEPKEMPNMPEKYRSQSTSELTVEVTEGANTHDFFLTP